MPDVLEFTPFHLAWLQGQSRVLAFQGLHPGQLIDAHHPLTLLGQFWRLLIELVDFTHLFIETFIRARGQPVTDQMRLEISLFLKVWPHGEQKSALQCHAG